MPNLAALIAAHRRHYEASEKASIDMARALYLDDAWSGGSAGKDVDRRMFASKAIIFAIAESAVASLVGSSPRVAPMPTHPDAKSLVPVASGLMDWVFRANRMRRRITTTLMDAVLAKRGIFKTGWDEIKGQPVIRAIDPTTLYFDLTVRDPDDISYWIEATVIPWSRFSDMRKKGKFGTKADEVKPDRYPKWLLNAREPSKQQAVIDTHRYVLIYEYYDVERGRVIHWTPQADVTLFEDTISYMPYSMYSLNHSGTDCLGLSAAAILLNSQQTVNDLLTLWKRIAYLQVPRLFYDAGRITDQVLNDSMRASVGSYIPLHPKSSMSPDARFSNLFFPLPLPDVPVGIREMIAKVEDDMAYTSALAEAARGRITGARTATEMMVMDAYNQTRLAAQAGNLGDAIEDVARKAYVLCSRHLPKEKMVRVSGGDFASVSVANLAGMDMDFEMVPYNALRRNPAVILDTLVQLLPVLSQAPNIVVPSLIETLVDLLMLPGERFLLSPEQMAGQMEAKQQAEQLAATRSAMGQVKPRPQGAAPEAGTGGAAAPPSNLADVQRVRAAMATPELETEA